jgi:hypothetical protein
MDLTDTIQPNSDQLDATDLLTGPRTFTIQGVSKGNAEQPVNIQFTEFPRPWRPGKSMRRVLVASWGADASAYVGRRVRLYCDPDVVFGGLAVGGTRIAALSHIDKPKKVPLLVSRGKSAIFVVQPLNEASVAEQSTRPAPAKQPTADELIGLAKSALAEDALNAVARKAVTALTGADLETVKAVVTARRAELKAAPAEPTLDWPDVKGPES